MKRSGPPARRTPLKRSSTPKRKPIKRKPSRAGFSDDTKEQIRRRSGGRCEASCTVQCHRRIEHFHHRRMRSQGGAHTADNGLGVCQPCHAYIHAHPAEAYMRGWLIRSGVEAPGIIRQSG